MLFIIGASTKEDIEKYLKTHKLFGADREDSGNPETPNNNNNNHNHNNNLPMSPHAPINNKLTPKPPATPLLSSSNNISPRVGNLITMTAASKRKIRGTQSAVLNLDDICDELLTVCQLEGKKYRLETLKKMLQSHIIYQISLLSLIKNDLHNINNKYQNIKETNESNNIPISIENKDNLNQLESIKQDNINSSTPSNNNTNNTSNNQNSSTTTAPSVLRRGMAGTDSLLSNKFNSPSKKNIRHVYVNDNLSMIDDDDDIDDVYFSSTQRTQYLSTGLLYAQSVSIHIFNSFFFFLLIFVCLFVCLFVIIMISYHLKLNQMNQN